MSAARQFQKALGRAASRDRKRTKRMKVTGKGVFTLRGLLRKSR